MKLRIPVRRNSPSASATRWLSALLAGAGVLGGGASLWGGEMDAPLKDAARALEQGLGSVAVGRLESLLKTGGLSREQSLQARALLSDALLRESRWEKVLALWADEQWADAEPGAAALLAQARAHSALGHWPEAAAAFESARRLGAEEAFCSLGLARALAALGRPREALMELGKIQNRKDGSLSRQVNLAAMNLHLDLGAATEAREQWSRFTPADPVEKVQAQLIEGRLWLAEGKPAEAARRFAEILSGATPLPPEVLLGAVLGQADSLHAQGFTEAAAKGLSQFLRSDRELPGLEGVFEKLALLLSESPDPSEAPLLEIQSKGSLRKQALAGFYLAEFFAGIGKGGLAEETFAAFCGRYPEHPLAARAWFRRALLRRDARDWAKCASFAEAGLRVSKDGGLRLDLVSTQSLALFRIGQFQRALEGFEALAREKPRSPEPAYNIALCALRLGNTRRALAEMEKLRGAPATAALADDLELEIALQRARDGQPQAAEALLGFLSKHPKHARTGEARITLAELAYQGAENASREASSGEEAARLSRNLRKQAADYLQAVARDPQTGADATRGAFLAVFLADREEPRSEERVVELAEAFVREHPDSELLPQMRMKLGELHFRRKDFANAETQFSKLAAEGPQTPLSETALYLAGQCAANLLNPGSVDRALAYWDGVARGEGPLRWNARYQQAAVKSRLGDEAEAVVLFDLLLKAGAGVEPELRLRAHMGKADALMSLSRRSSGDFSEALAEYGAIAEAPEVSPQWRNQALYKKGKALEGRQPDSALETYCRVLDLPGSVEAGEFFWLFKCGFDAARVLENRSAWLDAVGVYERLGKLGGPRSPEARNRAAQLRLEKFLWQEQ